MADRKLSDNLIGFFLLLLAGKGGNWLITPMRHPNASTLDYVLTWIQIVVCVVAGIYLLRKARSRPGAT